MAYDLSGRDFGFPLIFLRVTFQESLSDTLDGGGAELPHFNGHVGASSQQGLVHSLLETHVRARTDILLANTHSGYGILFLY